MRKSKPCLVCGIPHTRRTLCCSPECGLEHYMMVLKQITKKKGPYYEKWKRRWEAATGLKIKGRG